MKKIPRMVGIVHKVHRKNNNEKGILIILPSKKLRKIWHIDEEDQNTNA